MPLYWVFTLMLASIVLFAPEFIKSTKLTTGVLLTSLFFIPHFSVATPDQVWPLLVPGWSLNYEMFFYSLCVAGILVARERMLTFLVAAILCLVASGPVISVNSAAFLTYTNLRLLEFLGGAVLGALYLAGWLDRKLWLSWALPAGVTLILLADLLPPPYAQLLDPPIAGSIAVVLGLVALETSGFRCRKRFALLLGNASYSIYLSHLFTLVILRIIWPNVGWWVKSIDAALAFLAISLITSAIVGVIVYVVIEKPFLRLLRGRFYTGASGSSSVVKQSWQMTALGSQRWPQRNETHPN